MKTSLNILAVDDHQFFLRGIAEWLGSLPFVKVDTCNSYDSLKIKLEKSVPDIVFLDLNMPLFDGFTICREIKRKHKNVFVAMLTQYDSEQFVQRAREYGAGAYFIKNTEPEVFGEFLANFKDGRIKDFVVHIPGSQQFEIYKKEGINLIDRLSLREKQVLKMLVSGMENHQIESELHIGYETLKSHRTSILHKLQLKNIAELVKFSINHKLIEA